MRLRVASVIFKQENNGYTVLSCDEVNENGRVLKYGISAVGFMLPERKGAIFEAEVELSKSKYGEQYKIISFDDIDPTDKKGIVELIKQAKIKGIGQKKAERIYDALGENTLEILDTNFERIKEAKIFTKDVDKRVMEAKQKWDESRSLRDIYKRIGHDTNIGRSKLLKILNHFKDGIISVLDNTPYKICEIKGISFNNADTIARKNTNFNPNNEDRLKAGLIQVLLDSMMEGHLYLTSDTLIKKVHTLLNIDVSTPVKIEDIKTCANALLLEGKICATPFNNGVAAIYLISNLNDEIESAKKVVSLLSNKKVKEDFVDKIQKVLSIKEFENGITLAKKQRDAVVNALTHQVSIITGGPGRGKTTTLNLLLQTFKEVYPKKTIRLLAPTGRAARRMSDSTDEDASTIHSALNLRGDDDDYEPDVYELYDDLIVVDEMSMVDMKLFCKLMAATRHETRIVFVGDVNQLPSVGAGNVFAELINSKVIPTTVLDVPFRQSEKDLIYQNAERINEGNTNLVFGDSFEFIEASTVDDIADACVKTYKKVVNERDGDLDAVWLLTPFRKRTSIGANEMNLALQDEVNTNPNLVTVNAGGTVFRMGDKVMQTKNITDEFDVSFSNGDIGYVKALATGDANDSYIDVKYEGVGTYRYESREEFEMLDLAYASTIHKAQGSEVDVVIMPMSKVFNTMLKRNLVYTGVSRAKKKVYIVGSMEAMQKAILDNTYNQRNTLLGWRLCQEAKSKGLKVPVRFTQMVLDV